MAKPKKSKASNEEAIRLAKAEVGEETIAMLQGLPPEVRAALGSALVASAKPKNPGGRPKGSGMDHTPALRRMAELQEEDPNLEDDRPAARRVAAELKEVGVNVSPETLRKAYGPKRDELRAAVRERKAAAARPRFKVVVDLSEPEPDGSTRWTPPQTLGDAAKAMAGPLGRNAEEFMRSLGFPPRLPEGLPGLLGNYMKGDAQIREMVLGTQLRHQQAIAALEAQYAGIAGKHAASIAAMEAGWKDAIERLGPRQGGEETSSCPNGWGENWFYPQPPWGRNFRMGLTAPIKSLDSMV